MNTAFQPSGNEVKAEAFQEHRRAGRVSASQMVVLKALLYRSIVSRGEMTRNDIADATGLPLVSVCGRCKELLDADLITVAGTTQGKPARSLLALTCKGSDLAVIAIAEGD